MVIFEDPTYLATLEAIVCNEVLSLGLDLNITKVQVASVYCVIVKEFLANKAMF